MVNGYFDNRPCSGGEHFRYWAPDGQHAGEELVPCEFAPRHRQIMIALGYMPRIANDNFIEPASA